MLIRIYKANNPALGFSLLFIAAALWLPSILSGKEFIYYCASPLSKFFSLYGLFSKIISILLIFSGAILLNITIHQFHLLKNQSYLPGLLYVLLMSCIPETLCFHPVVLANLFLILALRRGFQMLGDVNGSSAAFDSALFVSVASLFYFPSALFVVFVWISLATFRSFSIRDWFISCTGLILPYLFTAIYYYCFGNKESFFSDYIFPGFQTDGPAEIYFLKSFYVLAAFLFIVLLISLSPLFAEMARNKASIRSGFRLFLWFTALSVISFVMAPAGNIFHFCFAAIPLSIIFSNMFLNIRQGLSEIIFSILIIIMVIYQWNYF